MSDDRHAARARDLTYLLVSVVSVVAARAVWFVLTNTGVISRKTIPSPQDIVSETRALVTEGYTGKPMVVHFRASLFRTLIGLGGSLVIGIPLGLLIGESRLAAAVLTPFFSFLRPVPAIAFIPLGQPQAVRQAERDRASAEDQGYPSRNVACVITQCAELPCGDVGGDDAAHRHAPVRSTRVTE